MIVDHNLGILNQQCKRRGVFKVFKTPPFLLFPFSFCWISFESRAESLLSHLHLSGRTLPWLASDLDLVANLLDHDAVILLLSTSGTHLATPLVHLQGLGPDKDAPLRRTAEIANALYSAVVLPLHRIKLDADPESGSKLCWSEIGNHPRLVAWSQLDALPYFQPFGARLGSRFPFQWLGHRSAAGSLHRRARLSFCGFRWTRRSLASRPTELTICSEMHRIVKLRGETVWKFYGLAWSDCCG